MSILQFIVDMKWVFTTLILVTVLVISAKRMESSTKAEVRKALLTRGWKAQMPGGFGLESVGQASESAATAIAPDQQIAQSAGSEAQPADAEQVATIRREAVTELMAEAARWGWTMGAQGFQTPPRPVIDWQGDQPLISYATGTPTVADRQAALNTWTRRQQP